MAASAYAQYDLIAPSVTPAHAVVALADAVRAPGETLSVERISLYCSDAGQKGQTIRIHFWRKAPSLSGGDNTVFNAADGNTLAVADISGYKGYVDVALDTAGTAGAKGVTDISDAPIRLNPARGTNAYMTFEARTSGGFTLAAGSSFSVTAEGQFVASPGARKQWAGHTPVPAVPNAYAGAGGAMLTRTRPIFPFPLRRFRLVIPLWSLCQYAGPVLMRDAIFGAANDTLGGGAASRDKLAFMFGVGEPTNSFTDVPARTPVTFNGAKFYQHDYTNNSAALAVMPLVASDIFDLGKTIPAYVAGFDLWSVLESESSYFATATVLPTTFVGSSAINRWEFFYRHASLTATPLSGIKAKGGNYDLALDPFPTADVPSLFVPTGYPSVATGGGNGYSPMYEVEIDGSWYTWAGWGDSETAGVGEGNTGSIGPDGTLYGDVRGSKYGNTGPLQRLICEEFGRPFLNLGKASNGAKFDNRTPDNTAARRATLKYFKPSDIIFAFGTNDIGGSTVYTPADSPTANKWSASTAYKAGQTVYNGANCYQCITSGTTAGSGGPTGTNADITDNTCHWKYLWALANSGIALAMQLGYQAFVRADLPEARTYQMTTLPLDTTTDNFKTVTGQTPASNWGDGSTLRGQYNFGVRKNLLGVAGIIDLGRYSGIENVCNVAGDFTATEDSKWTANGQANLLCGSDGGHPNSYGAMFAAHNLANSKIRYLFLEAPLGA